MDADQEPQDVVAGDDVGASPGVRSLPTTDWLITGKRQSETTYWWQFIGPFPSLEAAEKVRKSLSDPDERITFEMTPVTQYADASLGSAGHADWRDVAEKLVHFVQRSTRGCVYNDGCLRCVAIKAFSEASALTESPGGAE